MRCGLQPDSSHAGLVGIAVAPEQLRATVIPESLASAVDHREVESCFSVALLFVARPAGLVRMGKARQPRLDPVTGNESMAWRSCAVW